MAAGPVTTVYCSDLPLDMTEREFYNLFQFADGFEQASLKAANSGNTLMGFARFTTPEQAEGCALYLNGRVVDPATGASIKCMMAQKNLKPSFRPPAAKRPLDEAPVLPIPKAPRANVGQPGVQDIYQSLLALTGLMQGGGIPQHLAQPVAQPAPSRPCDTLYLGGLAPGTTEEELRSFCSMFGGFKDLRFINNGQKCFALVQFENESQAAQAMPQVGQYPIRGQVPQVAFSKSPLGVPKH